MSQNMAEANIAAKFKCELDKWLGRENLQRSRSQELERRALGWP